MRNEEEIAALLRARFPLLADKIYIQKEKRLFTKALTPGEFEQLVLFAHDDLRFRRATHVVGTDDGDTLGLLYIFSGSENILLALRESVPKANPVVNSIAGMYPSIELHERELVDLFGVAVLGLPEGPRYPLPDGWPADNYPLRKDWDPARFHKDTMTYDGAEEVRHE